MSGAPPLGRPSFANLVTGEERLELDKWLHQCRGPWRDDLQAYGADYREEMGFRELVSVSVGKIQRHGLGPVNEEQLEKQFVRIIQINRLKNYYFKNSRTGR